MSWDKIKIDIKIKSEDAVKALSKLADVFGGASSTLYEGVRIKRVAKAEGFARIEGAKADFEVQEIKQKAEISQKTHANEIIRLKKGSELMFIEENSDFSFEERTQIRVDFQQERKQKNLENVFGRAALELLDVVGVSDEPVDDDWNTFFSNAAADISNEKMQELWGRILAGEIKKPGTYSLRALVTVKSMTRQEAEIFEKALKISFIFHKGGLGILTQGSMTNDLRQDADLSFSEYTLLVDIGLIHPNNVKWTSARFGKESSIFILSKCGFISLENQSGEDVTVEFKYTDFTRVGVEIAQLIKYTNNFSELYLQAIKKNIILKSSNYNGKIGKDEKVILRCYDKASGDHSYMTPQSDPRIIE